MLLWGRIVRQYGSKREGISEMPSLKIAQVMCVFLHLDVLISVICYFQHITATSYPNVKCVDSV